MIFATRSEEVKVPLKWDVIGLPAQEGGSLANIPLIYAKQLVSQYKQKHHKHLLDHSDVGFNTIYVSIRMASLIQGLQTMYKNGDGADICRIYFGAHDEEEVIEDQDVSNKMTLIFVGAKTEGDCIVEQLNNTDLPAGDFGTLCPPQCGVCCDDDQSLARQVFLQEDLCPPSV